MTFTVEEDVLSESYETDIVGSNRKNERLCSLPTTVSVEDSLIASKCLVNASANLSGSSLLIAILWFNVTRYSSAWFIDSNAWFDVTRYSSTWFNATR